MLRRGAPMVGAAALIGLGPWLATRHGVRTRFLPAISGIGDKRRVALTFDDGPDGTSTPRLLRALDRLGWRATFFMLGSMVEANRSIAAEVAAAGHEIAVHGYWHRTHVWRGARDLRDDVARSTDVVAIATDTAPRWFRPPYGSLGWGTLPAVRQAGLQLVLWTTWGRDWRASATPASVAADVGRTLMPGGTILLHDSDCTSAPRSWQSTLGSLRLLETLFEEQGLTPGPLAEHGVSEPNWPRW